MTETDQAVEPAGESERVDFLRGLLTKFSNDFIRRGISDFDTLAGPVKSLGEFLAADRVDLVIVDRAGKVVKASEWAKTDEASGLLPHPINDDDATKRRSIVDELASEPEAHLTPLRWGGRRRGSADTHTTLSVPLVSGGSLVGALRFHSEGAFPGTVDGSEELRLIRLLGDLLASAVDRYMVGVAKADLDRRLDDQQLHDDLTGLPNRRLLFDRLTSAVERMRRSDVPLGVMFLDLDYFKDVNDTHGHSAGDAVLCEVAERLSSITRATDTVSRLSGDEFVVVCENITDPEHVVTLAYRITELLAQPIETDAGTVSIGASVGVAFGTKAQDDPEDLIRQADDAMYSAKAAGRSRVAIVPNAWQRD